jgi:biopolymer transport protein ExbD
MLTRINVTPIIDVALVLVIILLITAPMLQVADMDLILPEAHTRGAEDERKIIVTMSRTGELAVNETIIHAGQLPGTLGQHLDQAGRDEALVVVRADAGLPHHTVKEVLEQARAAGAQRLALATNQKIEALP